MGPALHYLTENQPQLVTLQLFLVVPPLFIQEYVRFHKLSIPVPGLPPDLDIRPEPVKDVLQLLRALIGYLKLHRQRNHLPSWP